MATPSHSAAQPGTLSRLAAHFRLFDFQSPETPAERLHFRIVEAVVLAWCVHAATYWAGYIENIETIAHPLGLAYYVPLQWLLNPQAPWLLAGAFCLFLALGFMRKWRYAYLAAFIPFLLLFAARYSLGEIPHSTNLVAMLLLGYGLGNALYTDGFCARRFGWGFAWLSIGLVYLSAGICKVGVAGLYWPLGEHLSLWIYNKCVDALSRWGDWYLSPLQRFVVAHRWAGTAFLSIGLAAELGAFLVWVPKLRRLALLAILSLHVGIYFAMDIFFRSAFATIVLLAIPNSFFYGLVSKARQLRTAS